MFCNSCGKEVSDNLKFCAYCGASMNSGVPVEPPAAPAPAAPTYPAAPAPTAPTYGVPAAPAAPVYGAPAAAAKPSIAITLDKVTTLGIFAVLAALTLVTMLLGWFTAKTKSDDIRISIGFPVFTLSSTIGSVNKTSNEWLKEMKDSKWYDDDDIKDYKKETAPLRTANTVLWIVKIMLFLAIFALLAAIYLVVTGNKKGALIAQVGFSLVVLAGIIAMIFGYTASSKIAGAIGGGDFGPSIWLWATIIVSGLGMALTTLKKNVLKGA